MHRWGDDTFDWEGLDQAIRFLDQGLRRWKIQVRQAKEKFGTARVYCHLGVTGWHDLFYPGWAFYQWPRGTYWLNDRPRWFWHLLNRLILPLHQRVYLHTYAGAVRRWPHLREELLCSADYEFLLRSLLDQCALCGRPISHWIPPAKWACGCPPPPR